MQLRNIIVTTDVDAHFQPVACKRTMSVQFGQRDEEDCPPSRGQDPAVSDCDERKRGTSRGLTLRSRGLANDVALFSLAYQGRPFTSFPIALAWYVESS